MTTEPSPLDKGRANLFYALEGLHLPLEERARHYQEAQDQFAQRPLRYAVGQGMSAALPATGSVILGGLIASQLAKIVPLQNELKMQQKMDPSVAALSTMISDPSMDTYYKRLYPDYPQFQDAIEASRKRVRIPGSFVGENIVPEIKGSFLLNNGVELPVEIDSLWKSPHGDMFTKHVEDSAHAARYSKSITRKGELAQKILKRVKLPAMIGIPLLVGLIGAMKSTHNLTKDMQLNPEEIANKLQAIETAKAQSYGRPLIRKPIEDVIKETLNTQLSDLKDNRI